ncbi:SDR family oxidoreductase [Achromobacter aloeverae]|uniref:Oxidoreductase n=1 Tax=Achromobacter aloeverae TaxID=1750518 RepID=A0A4V1MSJ9_9BURK|nr:SDR family oxidoreductase [Achromobacter aloeverae]RXN92300.1 oxidoreductase [Achromobacter aloeverae]
MNTLSSSTSTALPLAGKTAFVTGGSRGIGAAIVRRLARDGAAVAFTYRGSPEQAQALAKAVDAEGGRALALAADAADPAAVRRALAMATDAHGPIDILVNNAGVLLLGSVETFTLEDFDRTWDVNVRAVFVASQAALPRMNDGGRIVNIGSVNGDRMPFPGGAAYAMSKSALQGLVRGMARDLGPRRITVNNVQPGPTDTDMNPEKADFGKSLHDLMALQRHAHPDEIAGMVAYLAGPDAGFVTGANLTIDGGFGA